MTRFELIHPLARLEMLGWIPEFLDERNPASAREQIDKNYRHGGGWRPFKGHKMLPNLDLAYPGDPPTRALAKAQLRDELIVVYEHAWVAIIQPDKSFEIARID